MAIPTKRALVIGNNDYEASKLERCKWDAEDVYESLAKLGFKVTLGYDLNYMRMTDMIKDFINQIGNKDHVIFFFSGHGTEFQGQNYLIPIDNQCLIERSDRHEGHAVAVQKILENMGIPKPDLVVFLLDCCRTSIKGTKELPTGSSSTGIAPISGPMGSYIVYACGSGQTTIDRSPDDRHGLFTHHLLKHIGSTLKIDEIMCHVCDGIYNDSIGENYVHRSTSLRNSNVNFKTPVGGMNFLSDTTISFQLCIINVKSSNFYL